MTEEIESQVEPVRNTKGTGRKKQDIQAYRWQFTLKKMEEPEKLHSLLSDFCKEFYFQLERGESTDYEHYQGCFSLKTKERLTSLKNLIRIDVHLEPCKNWYALKSYCTKSETRIEGPWDKNSIFINLPTTLYDWQKKIVDLVSKPCTDDRTIHWFWDPEGCKGKTTLCKYLISKHNATLIAGATKDIAFLIPDRPTIIIMNITRTTEERVNYSALEACKDGLIVSTKYESKYKIFNSPHVLVFANFEPNTESMSKDRWSIVKIVC